MSDDESAHRSALRVPGSIPDYRRLTPEQSLAFRDAMAPLHVGMIHARKIVTVAASEHSFQISLGNETIAVVPRTTIREIHRYKAYATRTGSTR